MSYVYILHQPFNPANIQSRPLPQPLGWTPMSPLDAYDYGDMQGLGSFFKKVAKTVSKVALAPIKLVSPKLASNLAKIDNKVIDTTDRIHTSVNTWAKKHSTFLIIVAAIAITIYTMGAGASIAAKMLSGMKAIGAKLGVGAAASAATSGSAATGVSAMATGVSSVAAGTTAVSASGASWLAVGAKVALQGAKLLVNGKKVSDLSSDQAAQMLEAQKQGYNLVDPSLQPLLQQRAALVGGPIQFDSNGQPIEPIPGSPGTSPAAYGAGGGSGVGDTNPWLMPALVGGGALLLVLALK